MQTPWFSRISRFKDLKITLAREIVHTPMQNIHEEVSVEDNMVTVAKKSFSFIYYKIAI